MDYDALLELSTEIGYRLLESGGEIYRVEESIRRLLEAYGPQSAEIFVIPNCITACVVTPEGKTLTRVRRMGSHGTDIDKLERYNALCRKVCAQKPDEGELRRLVDEAAKGQRDYGLPLQLAAHFCGTAFFALFFGGSWRDGLCAGVCGMAICLCQRLLTRLRANLFFKTLLCAAVSALLAVAFLGIGLGESLPAISIGALMVLVPGLAITNAMREFMGGDMVTGVSRVAEGVLIGAAIAIGTGAALAVFTGGSAGAASAPAVPYLGCLYAFAACIGFGLIFNIHGGGILICCVGGALGFFVYLAAAPLVGSDIVRSFLAAAVIAVYSELMARVRRCPVTGYLLVALFPLVPGGGIYYAMVHCIAGETDLFLDSLLHTFGVAGALAVGSMLVSSAVRLILSARHHLNESKR